MENTLNKETHRLEAFSDGVFGFAITLLVLDIHVPELKSGFSLFELLLADWATYLSFLIGFFTILICWINHHYMFDFIHKSNSKLLLVNGFKLLMVTFTPFATSLLSKYINTPEQQTAISIYAFNFALMGTAMFVLWLYSCKNNMMKETSPKILNAITKFYSLAVILPLAIFLLSFAHIWFSLTFSGIMFSIFLFPELTMNFVIKTWIKEAAKE